MYNIIGLPKLQVMMSVQLVRCMCMHECIIFLIQRPIFCPERKNGEGSSAKIT